MANETTFNNDAVTTKEATIKFNFKFFALDSEGAKKVQALIDAGKLDKEAVTFGKNDKGVDGLKRNAVEVKTLLPVFNIEGYTKEMNEHLEFLVAKQVEAKNKDNIDTASGEWLEWHQVLQAAPINRSAGSIAVTKEEVNAIVEALVAWMTESKYPANGIELIKITAEKRFSAASIATIQTKHLEKIRAILELFVSNLDDDSQAAVEKVMNLFYANIDKVLAPEVDMDDAMFDL